MIELKNIQVSFDEKEVLKGISTIFDRQNIIGIVGMNGAGKSTFFNMLADIIKQNEGEKLLNNHPLTYKDCGYLETNNFFYSNITGNEYLQLFKQTNLEFQLDVFQTYFQLPLNDLIDNYSTGMKKKLALLAIIKQDNPIYLLDEPFNGLDLETNKIVEIVLLALKQKGKTIFISSHILEPLLSVCDEIRILEEGNFTKTYHRDNFTAIEHELFGKFKVDAKILIDQSV
jgi:ABC-2 type transport system ATP-binding protein